MHPFAWCHVGASVVGTSHQENGGLCEDSAVTIERCGSEGPVLIAVVSDGAGSAARGRAGSRFVVRGIARSAAGFVKGGAPLRSLGEETIRIWLDDLRDAIAVRAESEGLELRDYAATLVAALISGDFAVVAHIGDGACILGSSEGYLVPSWPAHGEYASSTYFATDNQVNLVVTSREGKFDRAAVFSDGLELLLLQHDTKTAFAPFFDVAFGRLRRLPVGRDRTESLQLATYLASEKVARRTDDDKTLLLGYRVKQDPCPSSP